MPYRIEHRGSKWCVINKETGENKGCSDTKEDAISHVGVLEGVHHGWKPTGKKKS